MKCKFFVIAVFIFILSGCDKVISISDGRLLEMVNDVSVEYDLIFETDDFDSSDDAILIFCYPQILKHPDVLSDLDMQYTEVQVDDITMLGDIYGSLLFSTVEDGLSIFLCDGYELFTIADDEVLSLDQYGISVPLGNIIDRSSSADSRYVVFVPIWRTFGTNPWDGWRTDSNELYSDISDNFSSIMEEVSKHIELN